MICRIEIFTVFVQSAHYILDPPQYIHLLIDAIEQHTFYLVGYAAMESAAARIEIFTLSTTLD